MLRFECDYTEGTHEDILKRLTETNREQTPGYGEDHYCENAARLIRRACKAEDADVHFLVGGTQTNTVLIKSMLRPHQGAVAAQSGHIATHETGAIEATGHKVLTLPSDDGKIFAEQVRALHAAHWTDEAREHVVQPGLVYISHPTETGLTYSKAELAALHAVCADCRLPLVIDGARLGYGLAAPGSDLSLPELARLCDAFYIGGTKLGALFGEAVVIMNPALKRDFRYIIKQHGGLLAKGRLLGLQFETLFNADEYESTLYARVSRHAVDMALQIREACLHKGFAFKYESMTNQQFPILPDAALERLNRDYVCSFWEKTDAAHTAVRYCTSWASRPEDVDRLCKDIRSL